jgi:hypothetical protein
MMEHNLEDGLLYRAKWTKSCQSKWFRLKQICDLLNDILFRTYLLDLVQIVLSRPGSYFRCVRSGTVCTFTGATGLRGLRALAFD